MSIHLLAGLHSRGEGPQGEGGGQLLPSILLNKSPQSCLSSRRGLLPRWEPVSLRRIHSAALVRLKRPHRRSHFSVMKLFPLNAMEWRGTERERRERHCIWHCRGERCHPSELPHAPPVKAGLDWTVSQRSHPGKKCHNSLTMFWC